MKESDEGIRNWVESIGWESLKGKKKGETGLTLYVADNGKSKDDDGWHTDSNRRARNNSKTPNLPAEPMTMGSSIV